MTAYQALEIWQVYISIPFVKADIGSALTAGLLRAAFRRKLTIGD